MYLPSLHIHLQQHGGLAQLARALAWHARGRRFDPDTLHSLKPATMAGFVVLYSTENHFQFGPEVPYFGSQMPIWVTNGPEKSYLFLCLKSDSDTNKLADKMAYVL